jgi:uncharacterized protein involved in exopolysaccharide biosynthesis
MSDSLGQPSEAAAPRWQDDTEEISFASLLAVLLRHRRRVVGLPLLVALVWVAIVLILPREYTAEAVFTPSTSSGQLSQLAGLAAQFGVSVQQGQTNESPAFYADLLQSQELLRSTVETPYRFPDSRAADADTLSGDLVTLLDVGGSDSAKRVEKAVEKLRSRLTIGTDATTGLVTVDVQTRWAVLSRDVASRLLNLVNAFNLETRQTQAAAERRFLEGRVETSRDSLRTTEDDLQVFLEHNRSYQNSPQLQFEYDRLQRHVTLQQQGYSTLAQSLEQAKIDQVRNTPVITVVEPPVAPARPDRRHLLLKAALGLVLGGVLAVAWAFGSEWARRAPSEEPEEYRELGREWAETKEDLRAAWRRLRRRPPR